VPLPWTVAGHANHGFSAVLGGAIAGPAWLPQPTGWGTYAAASQDADPSSMLTLYRSALRARSECLGDLDDGIVWIDDLGDDVVAFDRGTVRVVLNLSGEPLVLPERFVGRRRIMLSSEQDHGQDHGNPGLIPVDAAVWLA
jgi:alpha-glucosidase